MKNDVPLFSREVIFLCSLRFWGEKEFLRGGGAKSTSPLPGLLVSEEVLASAAGRVEKRPGAGVRRRELHAPAPAPEADLGLPTVVEPQRQRHGAPRPPGRRPDADQALARLGRFPAEGLESATAKVLVPQESGNWKGSEGFRLRMVAV